MNCRHFIPPPPTPRCSCDSNLSARLSSWYEAGFYAGFHKESHDAPHPPFSDHGNDGMLAAMLMAWYMAGYHTGRFQAKHYGNHNCNKRKASPNRIVRVSKKPKLESDEKAGSSSGPGQYGHDGSVKWKGF